MMQASSRAGRNYERWLLGMTPAGTRRTWWWPQVTAGDSLLRGRARGRQRRMLLEQLKGRDTETGFLEGKGKKGAEKRGYYGM